MINYMQFRDSILRPSLHPIGLYSPEDEQLLIATMAHESKGGTYLVQIGGGALGVYQMEDATYHDLFDNYLNYHPVLKNQVLSTCSFESMPPAIEMVWNLKYATIIARVDYLRRPEALPKVGDLDGVWDYYKKYYNSSKGDAQKAEFLSDYHTYIR